MLCSIIKQKTGVVNSNEELNIGFILFDRESSIFSIYLLKDFSKINLIKDIKFDKDNFLKLLIDIKLKVFLMDEKKSIADFFSREIPLIGEGNSYPLYTKLKIARYSIYTSKYSMDELLDVIKKRHFSIVSLFQNLDFEVITIDSNRNGE